MDTQCVVHLPTFGQLRWLYHALSIWDMKRGINQCSKFVAMLRRGQLARNITHCCNFGPELIVINGMISPLQMALSICNCGYFIPINGVIAIGAMGPYL